MIHTKSLIRRLAYVPWLLAFGLVLGWAGEAQAQTVKLSVDKTEVREDGGAVTIKVTAKTFDAAGDNKAIGARVVQLTAVSTVILTTDTDSPTAADEDSDTPGDQIMMPAFGRRFTMTLPSIVIGKDDKEVSVESVLTPIPTNHENDTSVTTGDEGLRYVPSNRIPNTDLMIALMGNAGAGTTVTEQPKVITMLDTDKPSMQVRLALDPPKVSKEAEETSVSVSGSLDGALVKNQTLSFLLRQITPSDETKDVKDYREAQRDEDYDIEVTTLSIARRKPSGSTDITITPKNSGIGFLGISGDKKLEISGTDLNNDGDARDSWTARGAKTANTGGDGELPQRYDTGPSIVISEVGLNMDFGDAADTGETTTIAPALRDHDDDGGGRDGRNADPDNTNPELRAAQTPNIWEYSEARVDLDGDGTADGLDLNDDGDTKDFVTEVKEAVFLHELTIVQADFQIDAGAIAATKGLTAKPSVVRESLIGQEEGSREVSVELSLEIKNALPDDARVRFFIRAHLPEDPDTDKVEAAERGTQYSATVDALTIPAGETKGTTTLNLTVFDNDKKNKDRVFRVEARVGTVPQYVFITIADDETPTTTIALSADPGEVKAETGEQEIEITATLNGDVFEEDAKITLVIVSSDDKPAARDTEYNAALRSLEIPAGETIGSTTVTVTALKGGDKKVWIGSVKNDPYAKNVDDDDILVSPVAVVLKNADAAEEAEDPGALKFGVDLASTVYPGMVSTEIEVIELPEAEGGEGDRTYSVSNNLPAGLEFDADELTISGTPTVIGKTEVVYAVIDSEGSAATKFTIDVAAPSEPTADVESVELSQSSVRESADATDIMVTAVLAEPAEKEETVTFVIGEGDPAAKRDVHYNVTFSAQATVEVGGTKASTTLTLTPVDNEDDDGDRALSVTATASGSSESADITIADDETPSDSITLSAAPHTVKEDAGTVAVLITATLNGRGAGRRRGGNHRH